MSKKYFIPFILLLAVCGLTNAQTVYKVDTGSVAVTPDGLSWDSAFVDLQQALDSASSGDTIFVSEGIYTPDPSGTDSSISFTMKDSVVIMGGFSAANNDTTLATRDYVNYVTILSGEIQGDADSTNNSRNIIENKTVTLTAEAVLDGFTIEGAFNNIDSLGIVWGGGIVNFSSSPTFRNLIITNNTVSVSAFAGDGTGAGVLNNSSSPTFTNCTFTNNVIDADASNFDRAIGAAVANYQTSNATFFSCSFSNNSIYGGSTGWGGGAYNQNSSNTEFENCVFQFNHCEITGTSGGQFANGAGIFNHQNSSSDLTNCLLSDNTVVANGTALAWGGAIANFSGFSAYTISNTTITNNSVSGTGDSRGGGIWIVNDGGGITVNNTILSGNTALTQDDNFSKASGTGLNYENSLIEGSGGSSSWVSSFGTDDGNNIDEEPNFTDDANQNYRPTACSPAVDAGSNSLIPGGITIDLDSNTRNQGSAVDMGAYELDPVNTCGYSWIGVTDTDWGTATNWSGNAVPPDTATIIIPDSANDPVLDTIRIIDDLYLHTGATLTLGKNRLRVNGNMELDGTIVNDSSVIELISGSSQNIEGNLTIDTLIKSGSGTATITAGETSIRVELRPEDGEFATGNSLTLLSDSILTARIAEIQSGASISGQVTANQYVGGTDTEWRILSSPINNVSTSTILASWADDIVTTGFNNALYPASVFPWVNVYTYDETVGGTYENGYDPATNTTNLIPQAEGFMIYMGPYQVDIDLVGLINSGTINKSLSFTSSGGATEDGWHMLGNPYPSDIDFTGLTLTNVTNAYDIYNPNTGSYDNWNEAIQSGTGQANGIIAQQQGFWVQTTTTGASIVFHEADKTTGAGKAFFKRARPLMRIYLSNSTKQRDDILLNMDPDGTFSIEEMDSRKLYGNDTTMETIAFHHPGSDPLEISTIPLELEGEVIIPIKTSGTKGNNYTLDFSGTELLTSKYCVVLEDLNVNKVISLSDSTSYTYTAPQNGFSDFLQLRITTTPSVSLTVNGNAVEILPEGNEVCENDKVVLTANGLTSSAYSWNNNVVNGQPFNPEAGVVTYEVSENFAGMNCALSNSLILNVHERPEPTIEREDNMLSTEVYSTYQWYKNGSILAGKTTQEIESVGDGNYVVEVNSEYGCYGRSDEFDMSTTGLLSMDAVGDVNVYPNPGKDFVTITIGHKENVQMYITNIIGKTVMDKKLTDKGVVTFNTSELDNGVYFINIIDGDEVVVKKWVKQ